MTEAEWLACTDPKPMLEYLQGKASERKLKLFAVACCRRTGYFCSEEYYRHIVELVEKGADGLVVGEDLRIAVEIDLATANNLDIRLVPSIVQSDNLEAATDAVTEAVESAA